MDPTHPTTFKNEDSNKKTQRVRGIYIVWPPLPPGRKKSVGQQEQEHDVIYHVQGENYQKKSEW